MFQLTIYHILKLFTTTIPENGTNVALATPQQGLVSESYDEIIFQDPTQLMQQLLMVAAKPASNTVIKHDTDCKFYSLLLCILEQSINN